MAHKVLDIIEPKVKKRKRITLAEVEGKFGFGLMLGQKEIFIGITVFPVIVEQVVKRRMVKIPKAVTKVYNYEA